MVLLPAQCATKLKQLQGPSVKSGPQAAALADDIKVEYGKVKSQHDKLAALVRFCQV